MTTFRAAMIGVKYSSRPSPDEQGDQQDRPHHQLQTPNPAARNGFGLIGRTYPAHAAWLPFGPARSRRRGPGPRGAPRVPDVLAVADPRTRLRVGSRARPAPRRSVGRARSASSSGRRLVVGLGRRLAAVLRLGHGAPVSGSRCGVERLALRGERFDDLGAQHRDVARAHRDDDVAGAHRVGDLFGDGGEVRHVVHRLADVFGHRRSADRLPSVVPARHTRRARRLRLHSRAPGRTHARKRLCANTSVAGTPPPSGRARSARSPSAPQPSVARTSVGWCA